MTTYNRYSYNSSSHLYCLIFKYFTGFINKFLLLGCVAVWLESSAMRETVLINLMSIDHLSLYPGSFVFHLSHRFYTGTRYRLICRNNKTFDLVFSVEGSQDHHHLNA